MNNALFLAQAGASASIIHWVILAVIVAGVVGIGLIALRQAGITIPPFIVQIGWIVLAVIVAILAIKFIAGYV